MVCDFYRKDKINVMRQPRRSLLTTKSKTKCITTIEYHYTCDSIGDCGDDEYAIEAEEATKKCKCLVPPYENQLVMKISLMYYVDISYHYRSASFYKRCISLCYTVSREPYLSSDTYT